MAEIVKCKKCGKEPKLEITKKGTIVSSVIISCMDGDHRNWIKSNSEENAIKRWNYENKVAERMEFTKLSDFGKLNTKYEWREYENNKGSFYFLQNKNRVATVFPAENNCYGAIVYWPVKTRCEHYPSLDDAKNGVMTRIIQNTEQAIKLYFDRVSRLKEFIQSDKI